MKSRATEQAPSDARVAERQESAQILQRAHYETGISREANGAQTGAGSTRAKRWADPTEKETITIVDVRRSFSELAIPLLDWAVEPHAEHPDALGIAHKIAEAQGHVVVCGDAAAETTGDFLQVLHRVSKEGADVVVALSGAIADGTVTAEEKRLIAREAREQIRELSALLLLLEPQEARGRA